MKIKRLWSDWSEGNQGWLKAIPVEDWAIILQMKRASRQSTTDSVGLPLSPSLLSRQGDLGGDSLLALGMLRIKLLLL